MIISAAIVSKKGEIFCCDYLPYDLKIDINKHANNFIDAIGTEDDDVELPYIETTNLRYIYKQTDDLYWLLVTKVESEMFTDIHVLGKFVCTIMEYGSCETDSKNLTDEQREIFYRHIWRPWDEGAQCPTCNCHCDSASFWEREFESRLQFLISIRDGHVDENDVDYFNKLIAEAWTISAKLYPRLNSTDCNEGYSSETDSLCSSASRCQSISEETVIDGCRLKCRLEDIRVELVRIQDPYLRLFARRNLLNGSRHNPNTQMSSAPSLRELGSDSQCESDVYLSSNCG